MAADEAADRSGDEDFRAADVMSPLNSKIPRPGWSGDFVWSM